MRRLWAVPTYRFAFQFLVFLVAIALAYPALNNHFASELRSLESFTASVVYHALRPFSADVELTPPSLVTFSSFSVQVIDECAGVHEVLIFGAAVIAYPTTWTNTLVGLALGIPLLYLMNIVRIAGLLVAGHWHRESFEFMHIYFWQITMLIMIASTWLLWLTWVVRDEAEPPAPA